MHHKVQYAISHNPMDMAIDAAIYACKTAPALEIRRTLQRGVAILTARCAVVPSRTAESSIRDFTVSKISGSAGNRSVVSETFAQTGEGRAFRPSEVKAALPQS